MTSVTYVARRSLVAGHTINTSYSLRLHVVDMPVSRNVNKTKNESLNHTSETIRLGAYEVYDVELAIADSATAANIKEFLDSVEDGQEFTFDPYGLPNAPHNPLEAEIESTGYNRQRFKKGQGGANDASKTSFSVRVIFP